MIEEIIFYLLLIDSIFVNLAAWFGMGRSWYRSHAGVFGRMFPITKGWAIYYLVLVLWVGSFLARSGSLQLLN